MLEDSVFESARRRAKRSPLTITYSVLIHGAAIGVLILVPLLQMQAVPIPRLDALLPPPHFIKTDEIPVVKAMPAPRELVPDPDAVIAPTVLPSEIARIVEAPPAVSLDVPQSGRGASIRSIFTEAISKPEETLPPPPKPPEPEPAPARDEQPVRVSGGVQQALLIRQVLPTYPQLALQARIQGVVVLDAIINKEGTIDSLRVVSGHPLLIRAAIEAVQQWVYKPTLLNGDPVAVETTITVNFSFR
jgi:periplasmic protein TonB